MSIRNASRSTKAALIITSMAATFLVVFVITLLCGNAIRKDDTKQPALIITHTHPPITETPSPTTESPTTIPPTKLIESTTKTTPPTTALPSTIPYTNAQMECVLPTTDGGVDSRQLGKVIEGDNKDYALIGQPVAMSHDGNRVVLGSPWGDTVPEGQATVKAFDFKGYTWDEAGTFYGPNEDKYGLLVSLSGDGKRLAISAIWTRLGHVETYDFVKGTDWKSVGQKLTGTNTNDLFGRSISLSNDGSRMAIGAIRTDVNGEDSGSVRVYELERGIWKQLGKPIHGEAADDQFGIEVSLSGDGSIVAVGAFYSDEKGSESGSVRIFRYSLKRRTMQDTQDKRNIQSSQDTGKWIQVGQKLLGGASGDWFGFSLSINKNGDTLAISAHRGNYVQVFHLDNNQWYQMGDTLNGQGNFGYSVFLAPSSNRIAVGSYDSNEGYVRIFDFDGNDWVQIGIINSPSSETYFGTSVSLSNCGDRLAVGSIYEANGCLRVYEFI